VKAFKFRAQAALDLRDRELTEAQRQLARVEEVRDAARRRLEAADAEAQQARDRATEAHRTTNDASALQWYRFWILRLDHERKAHAAALAAREKDVAQATAACVVARQKRESLDKFRQKAKAAHEQAQLADEMKVIDELAARRFVAQN